MRSLTRILYLDYTNSIGVGGGQRSLALLIRHLNRSAFSPVLACPSGEGLIELVESDVEWERLQLPDGFRSLSRFDLSPARLSSALTGTWGAARELGGMIRRRQIHLVHANNLKMLLLVAAAAPGIPRIWHVRDIYPRTPKVQAALEVASRLASRTIAVSHAVASALPEFGSCTVVHNAVDLPEQPGTAGCLGAPPTIGFVGRLDWWKGIATLLAAFDIVRRQFPRARLLVVGSGPEDDRVEGPGVVRMPFQKDLEPVWRQIDVAVVPSTEPDPFPRSVIEAMAWAKPVVGSATGGIPEAIADGETGYLFPPGDAAALAARLGALLADPPRAAAMGEASRLRCERYFSSKAQAARIAGIYEELAGFTVPAAA